MKETKKSTDNFWFEILCFFSFFFSLFIPFFIIFAVGRQISTYIFDIYEWTQTKMESLRWRQCQILKHFRTFNFLYNKVRPGMVPNLTLLPDMTHFNLTLCTDDDDSQFNYLRSQLTLKAFSIGNTRQRQRKRKRRNTKPRLDRRHLLTILTFTRH